jgi:DNA polymerase III alpha subunit
LHVHSWFSLLDGLSSPEQIAKRAKEIGCPACALTDHGNVSGMVDFQKACKKYGIKPVYGCEIYTSKLDQTIKTNENKSHNHLTILAKNDDGIKELMSLVSYTNQPEHFYRKPRIGVDNLHLFTKNRNLICLSGCIIGELSESLFTDVGQACLIGEQTEDMDEVRKLLKPNWRNIADEIVARYISIFGKENYFIELQEEGMPAQKVAVECLREVSKALDVPSACTLDAHYAKREQVEDHRILLYSQLHTTAEEQARLKGEGADTMSFFFRDTFYIFSPEEMQEHYSKSEMEQTLVITDMIKSTSIGRKPCLPKYQTPNNDSSDDYLKKLCVQGAKNILSNLSMDKKKIYWTRLLRELSVIKEARLADYFLIVYDACKFVDENKAPRGKGRGSGAGSLVNYLLNITGIDPIEYDLYWERFYNHGRNIPPHFDVGPTTFMEWLSDNSDSITQEKIDDTRNIIKNLIIQCNLKYKSIHNKKLLKEEADWIDNNNPKMWLYILEVFKNNQTMCSSSEDQVLGLEFPNPNNSHIVDALRMCCKLDENKSVQTNPGHISLPDIDMDIGVVFREKVVEYLINKWGEDKVSQMVTFGRLQGKAALKEVFRAQPDLVKHLMKVKATKEGKNPNEVSMTPFDLSNEITGLMPDEASIIDDLQKIRKETENSSYGILNWSIDNIEKMKEYYQWYKPLFDQSMRLEGTKKSQSRHAAGLVIADVPINDLVPLIYDPKNKTRIVGLEMESSEALGCVKFDFLGVVALDKVWLAQDLINGIDSSIEIQEGVEVDD